MNTGTSSRLPKTSTSEKRSKREAAGRRGNHDQRRGDEHAPQLRQAQIAERQADADELGDDRQRVEQKQVDDAEGAPKFAKALEDQPGMPDAGNRAETQHHLLVDVEDRDQQRQCPQQGRAIILAGLRVGAEGAGVIVADHDDEPRPEDREQRLQLGNPAGPWGDVALPDRAERAVDVTDMGVVEDGARGRRCGELSDGGHGFPPSFAALGRRGVATGRFGQLLSDAELVGAPAHLGPDFIWVDAAFVPKNNQMIEEIGALADDAA
jgi:hypothetical protein